MYAKRSPKEGLQELKSKKMMGDNLIVQFVIFLVNIVIVFPIWLTLLLPLTIAFSVYNRLKKHKQPLFLEIDSVATDLIPQQDRKYDVVIYGATGFTGKMACEYIAKQYPKLRWAIGGRSSSKLQEVVKHLSGIDSNLEKNLDIIIADSYNVEQLKKMVQNTKVVVSTVGPYTAYGNYLVALCCQYGTHYTDLTGELDWVKVIIEKYDSLAVKSGAQIVNTCGYDSIPFDLTTLYLNEQMNKQKNQRLKSVYGYCEQYLNASGGTLASVVYILTHKSSFVSKLGYDALLKNIGENTQSKSNFKFTFKFLVGYAKEFKKFFGLSVGMLGNGQIVKRSNALLHYHEDFRYGESVIHPNIFSAINTFLGILLLLPLLIVTPLKQTIGKLILPNPGEGPSQKEMDKGFLIFTAIGKGENGAELKAAFTMPTDPGYRDTARILAESGITLALNQDQIKVKGGFYTSASCQGNILLEKICQTGSTIQIVQ